MAEPRKGRQTPTQAVILPYTRTYGQEAAALYSQTGRKVQEWQELLLCDIMAQNSSGLWVHTKFGYSVPRRNGKNEIVAIREMWGLKQGESILHTAHRTTTSHTAWERLSGFLDKAKIEYKSVRATGRENIRLPDGGKIEFRTRTSKGGLGEGFDLLVIDEAQEYQDDQDSALKYTVTDSHNPQTILCGTPPTPTSSGTVFTKMRTETLRGDRKNTGWAEWSVERQTDPHDVHAWLETNPSLGTTLTERAIEDEIGPDAVDFNIQRLGLWLKYNQKSQISRAEWEALKCPALPKLKGKLHVGIKYGQDGKGVAVSIAVKTQDDRIFVESIDWRAVRSGNDWILAFLKQTDAATVTIDGASGQQILADEIKDAGIRKKPILPTVRQIITANAAFEQGLYNKRVCHMNQPSLTQVVSNCEKRAIGTNGGFGYRSLIDDAAIELMDSVILAYWQCGEAKEHKPQKVRY